MHTTPAQPVTLSRRRFPLLSLSGIASPTLRAHLSPVTFARRSPRWTPKGARTEGGRAAYCVAPIASLDLPGSL